MTERKSILDVFKVICMVWICGAHVMSVIEFFLPRVVVVTRVHEFPFFLMSLGLYFLNGFLFISGFIAWESMQRGVSPASFLKQRLLRLWPGLSAGVTLAWMIGILTTGSVFFYLTFLINLLPFGEHGITWLWYPALDLQLHLIFLPLFSYLHHRKNHAILPLCLLVLLCILVRGFLSSSFDITAAYLLSSFPEEAHNYYRWLHLAPWSRFGSFVMGALGAEILRHKNLSSVLRIGLSLFGIAGLGFVFLSTNLTPPGKWISSPVWNATTDFFVTSFFLGQLVLHKDLQAGRKILRFLAQRTYGIYLFHFFVIFACVSYRGAQPWLGVLPMLLLWGLTYGGGGVLSLIFERILKFSFRGKKY